MILMLATSYVFILPLHKIERYLVISDPYVNRARLVKFEDDDAFMRLVTSDAVLKRSVTEYVRARESYDFPRTGYRDYHLVRWMSTPPVFDGYNKVNHADNPDEPFKTFGKERSIWITFVNTQLRRIGDEKDLKQEAVVRFQRIAFQKMDGTSLYHDSKIATIEYTFDRNLLSDPEQRANNPLGFVVTSYRVDNDGSAPPPAPAANTQKTTTNPQAQQQPVAGAQQASAVPSSQGQQIPQFGAPVSRAAPNTQPQPQYPAQPAVQSQPTAPVGQVPNQVNGVRN
jgi:type IV secretion system protein VirB8